MKGRSVILRLLTAFIFSAAMTQVVVPSAHGAKAAGHARTYCGGVIAPCGQDWSGNVEAVITGADKQTSEVYDLGTKVETTEYRTNIRVKVVGGSATETADYTKTVNAKTTGKQFCGTNAQPQYAEYSDAATTSTSGQGTGEAELTVSLSEGTNTYSIKITPNFQYELKTEYNYGIGAQCTGNRPQNEARTWSVPTSSGILITQLAIDPKNPNLLTGRKTETLLDGGTAVYTWRLTRCESCEFKAIDANTKRPLTHTDLERFGYTETGGVQTIKTGAGQRLEFTLADGSVLRLSPNSQVEFDPCDPGFKDASKKITIKLVLGKIWAHVQKMAGRQLEVTTENAFTGVRGTTFEVAYSSSSQTTFVTVEEGSVYFGTFTFPDHPITIDAGKNAITIDDTPKYTIDRPKWTID